MNYFGRRGAGRPSRFAWLAVATIVIFTACSGGSTIVTPNGGGVIPAVHGAPTSITITPVKLPAGASSQVLSVTDSGDVYFGSTSTLIPGFCLYLPYGGGCSNGTQGLYRYSGGTVTLTMPRGPYFERGQDGFITCNGAVIPSYLCSFGNVSAIDAAQLATPLWASDYAEDAGAIPISEGQWGGSGGTATVPPAKYNAGFASSDIVVSLLIARNGQPWIGSGGPVASAYPAKLPAVCNGDETCDLFFLVNGPGENVWAMTHTYTNLNASSTIFFEFSPNGTLMKTVQTSDIAVRIAGTSHDVWFTDFANNAIGRLNAAGTIKEYPLPTKGAGPYGITVASDGALWFAEYNASQVGRISMSGKINEYPISFQPFSIAATPPGCKTGVVWVGSLGPNLAEITSGGSTGGL